MSSGPQDGSNHPSSPSPPSASNLYLVTFLATLFLLLFISCAIILRSYILRRRYHRHIQGALGSGMLLTPRTQGSRYARFGHLPKLFDSWITNGGRRWHDMRPVAAQPVFVKRKRKDSVKTSAAGQPIPFTSSSPTTRLPYDLFSFFPRFRRPQVTPSSGDIEPCPSPSPVSTSKSRVEMLQISVLIALPTQHRAQQKNALLDSNGPESDDEALPDLLLGITKVQYRHKNLKPAPQPSSPPDIPPS